MSCADKSKMREELHMVNPRPLVFVHGKGGVGKTCVSQAFALQLARRDGGKRTLWVEFENPSRPMGELVSVEKNLWHLNAEASLAFDEYAAMKIGGLGIFGAAGLTKLFLKNKLIQYLAQAAPGIRELVLLGKVWYERNRYDHVVIDMPSTGYALAMFQSTMNFAKLFRGGPLNRDAEAITATMGNPKETAHWIIAIPEEMPLREGLELGDHLKNFFPGNPAHFLLNKRFPKIRSAYDETSDENGAPFSKTVLEFAQRRAALEARNMALWKDHHFAELPFIPPPESQGEPIAERIAALI